MFFIYTKVVSRFEKFTKSKDKSSLLCVPKCLAYFMDGVNDFIVLQDVSPMGFRQISRNNCLDYESCCSMLHAMAKFHAISFAFKDQKSDEFDKLKNSLIETYYSKPLWEWYERFEVRTTQFLMCYNLSFIKLMFYID